MVTHTIRLTVDNQLQLTINSLGFSVLVELSVNEAEDICRTLNNATGGIRADLSERGITSTDCRCIKELPISADCPVHDKEWNKVAP